MKAVLRSSRSYHSRGEFGGRGLSSFETADLAWVKKHVPASKIEVVVRAYRSMTEPADRGLTQVFLISDLKGARQYAKALIEDRIAVASSVYVMAPGWPLHRRSYEPEMISVLSEDYEAGA